MNYMNFLNYWIRKWTININIVGGNFSSSSIDLGNGISLTNKNSGRDDGMLIKYNARGEVEWAEGIGGTSDSDHIESVSETSDGGYIVGG